MIILEKKNKTQNSTLLTLAEWLTSIINDKTCYTLKSLQICDRLTTCFLCAKTLNTVLFAPDFFFKTNHRFQV